MRVSVSVWGSVNERGREWGRKCENVSRRVSVSASGGMRVQKYDLGHMNGGE